MPGGRFLGRPEMPCLRLSALVVGGGEAGTSEVVPG